MKYDRSQEAIDRTQLFEDLCDSVIATADRLKAHCDGILLLLDECDKPAVEAHLGEFTKSSPSDFHDRVQRMYALDCLASQQC